jgi:ubiquinone/menaquinone biosynthesis C-methylase UbiE
MASGDYIRALMRIDSPTRIPERIVPGRADRLETAEHMARYGFAARVVSGVTLDLGSGVGYGTAILEREGQAVRTIGSDISAEALGYGKATYEGALSFVAADARALPFSDASVDTVICIEAIEHVPFADLVLSEIARVLRPDGVLVISTPNKWMTSPLQPRPVNPYHVREWTRRAFVRLIAQRFRVERILGQSWHPRSTMVRVLWLNARQQLKTTLGRLGLLEGFRRVLRRNIPVPTSTGQMPSEDEVRAAWPSPWPNNRHLAVTTMVVARKPPEPPRSDRPPTPRHRHDHQSPANPGR